ncbi:tail fiber domain-containing protein [Aeromonas enterica]
MIQLFGVITDPAGVPVPGALIELRALGTSHEVLMGSVLTFKCDPVGGYRFPLAVGTYDVYAQNDLCGDMDYMGTGSVTADSIDGTLNSILVDNGINLTPPLLDRALDAMQRAELAAQAAEQDLLQTGADVIATQQAAQLAAEHADAASASAMTAGSQADEAKSSAIAAAGSATRAQTWAEQSVDVAVTEDQYSALHHAAKANDAANTAISSASASAASAATAAAKATDASESAALAATHANEAATSAATASAQADAASSARTEAAAFATDAGTSASSAEAAAQVSEQAKAITVEHAERVTTLAQQVSADSAMVQTQSIEVANHAATVAAQRDEVSANAASVAQASVAVQEMRDVVVAKTDLALAAADTASEKASQAEQDQVAASASAERASLAETMAEAWAQTPEGSDINGQPGEYSALHWALQAQKWAKAITSQLVWLGAWNAAAGTPPTPAENQGIPFYRISHDGVIATVSYVAGDYLHWDPATANWFKIDGSDVVVTVNGMTGAVVLGAADVGAKPASWLPSWDEVTDKPATMPPSPHDHVWAQLSNIPETASRWPGWTEVTDKPALAAAEHTHPYMEDGGSYDTLYLSQWFRSTGNTGWYSQAHGGGIYMEDVTWVRTYGGKKFYVTNTDDDALRTEGGMYAAGNGNFNDVYIRSDRRLKSNITPITDALAKVRRLSGDLYDKAGRREAGLIAQELAEVQPESVFLNADGTLSIAQAGVLALLVEAVKALDEKLESY